jgi:thiol-disulfide isomerase/thioredoxin
MIVNFWARWCGPCRAEIPELVALHARGAGVDIVGINIEQDLEPVRDFARAYEINYPVRVAREGGLELMRALGNPNAGLPFTLVLDKRGAVVALRLGLLTRAHLDAAVQRALK